MQGSYLFTRTAWRSCKEPLKMTFISWKNSQWFLISNYMIGSKHWKSILCPPDTTMVQCNRANLSVCLFLCISVFKFNIACNFWSISKHLVCISLGQAFSYDINFESSLTVTQLTLPGLVSHTYFFFFCVQFISSNIFLYYWHRENSRYE